ARTSRRNQFFECTVAYWACTFAEMNKPVRSDRQIVADLFDNADEFVLNDQGCGLRVLDDVADFRAEKPKVYGHGYKTCFGRCRIYLDPFNTIVSQDGDAIALRQTEAKQGVGEAAGALIPLCESHRTIEVAGADATRQQTSMNREHLPEIQ